MSIQSDYEEFLKHVETRSWAKCDTLSGEKCSHVAVHEEQNSAMLAFECGRTNKPHLRTVLLDRVGPDAKWTVRAENTVNLPTPEVSEPEHVCTTSNTRENVPSIPHPVTISGGNVMAIKDMINRYDGNAEGEPADDLVEYLRSLLS